MRHWSLRRLLARDGRQPSAARLQRVEGPRKLLKVRIRDGGLSWNSAARRAIEDSPGGLSYENRLTRMVDAKPLFVSAGRVGYRAGSRFISDRADQAAVAVRGRIAAAENARA